MNHYFCYMNKYEKLLKINTFERAAVFIEQNGSFAPFGAKLHDEGIQDVVVYNEFEEIDTTELIERLRKDFISELQNQTITAGAIAYDVIATVNNSDGMPEKRDALCLLLNDGSTWKQEYFPYMLINDQCVWR